MPQLNLPSPRRTVTKGIRVCARMNLDEDMALHLIDAACQAALDQCVDQLEGYPNWLRDVQMEARCRHQPRRPGNPNQ